MLMRSSNRDFKLYHYRIWLYDIDLIADWKTIEEAKEKINALSGEEENQMSEKKIEELIKIGEAAVHQEDGNNWINLTRFDKAALAIFTEAVASACAPTHQETVSALERWMESATSGQRINLIHELIGPYCDHCGDKDPHCQCWNDE